MERPTVEQIEQDLLKQGNEAAHNNANRDPMFVFKDKFDELSKPFQYHISYLNNKDLRRLCFALISYPLYETKFNEDKDKHAEHSVKIGIAMASLRDLIDVSKKMKAEVDKEKAEQEAANVPLEKEKENG